MKNPKIDGRPDFKILSNIGVLEAKEQINSSEVEKVKIQSQTIMKLNETVKLQIVKTTSSEHDKREEVFSYLWFFMYYQEYNLFASIVSQHENMYTCISLPLSLWQCFYCIHYIYSHCTKYNGNRMEIICKYPFLQVHLLHKAGALAY